MGRQNEKGDRGSACVWLPGTSEPGIPNSGDTGVGGLGDSALPHLQTAVIRAPGPLLAGWAGSGRRRGTAVLPQPLQEEVIDGCEVVVAAVLQGLGEVEAEKQVRAGPEGRAGTARWPCAGGIGTSPWVTEAPWQGCSQGYSWVAQNIP